MLAGLVYANLTLTADVAGLGVTLLQLFESSPASLLFLKLGDHNDTAYYNLGCIIVVISPLIYIFHYISSCDLKSSFYFMISYVSHLLSSVYASLVKACL